MNTFCLRSVFLFCCIVATSATAQTSRFAIGITPLAYMQRLPVDKFSYSSAMGVCLELTGDSSYVYVQFRADYVLAPSCQPNFAMIGMGLRSYALRIGQWGFSALGEFSLCSPFAESIDAGGNTYESSLPTPIQLTVGIHSEWYADTMIHPYIETVYIKGTYAALGKYGAIAAARLGLKFCL